MVPSAAAADRPGKTVTLPGSGAIPLSAGTDVTVTSSAAAPTPTSSNVPSSMPMRSSRASTFAPAFAAAVVVFAAGTTSSPPAWALASAVTVSVSVAASIATIVTESGVPVGSMTIRCPAANPSVSSVWRTISVSPAAGPADNVRFAVSATASTNVPAGRSSVRPGSMSSSLNSPSRRISGSVSPTTARSAGTSKLPWRSSTKTSPLPAGADPIAASCTEPAVRSMRRTSTPAVHPAWVGASRRTRTVESPPSGTGGRTSTRDRYSAAGAAPISSQSPTTNAAASTVVERS